MRLKIPEARRACNYRGFASSTTTANCRCAPRSPACAKIDTPKKLRILIRHAKDDLKWLDRDPSNGIKRGKSKEIRAWTDAEMAAFEKRWRYGTKQRAAYELMLDVGTARIDTHLTTWVQADADDFQYTRRKTGVSVLVEKAQSVARPSRHFLANTSVS